VKVMRKDQGGAAQTMEVKVDDVLQPDDVVIVKESWF
jgi:hypothetical protein